MNVERLHAIALKLFEEIETTKSLERLQQLVGSLQNMVNQPQVPAHQQTFSNNLKAMMDSVSKTNSDDFSPAWRQILKEINGEELLGQQLKENIEKILGANQLTPSVAVQELSGLLNRLTSFKAALKQAIDSFRALNIGDEKLAPGECEIGLMIPRSAVKNKMVDFAKELEEMPFILNTFCEVATGQTDEFEIRSISSSELLIFLKATASYASCLAAAVAGVAGLYKQLLKFRKIIQEAKEAGAPDKATVDLESHANKIMETGIEKLSVDIVAEFHKKSDGGRKHELITKTRLSLNRIANRIDHGFNIEVRVEPLPQDADPKEKEENQKAVNTIRMAAPNMHFMKLEGQPLLSLPENEDPKHKK